MQHYLFVCNKMQNRLNTTTAKDLRRSGAPHSCHMLHFEAVKLYKIM